MILDGCFWLRLFRTESSSLSQVPGVSAPVAMVGLQGVLTLIVKSEIRNSLMLLYIPALSTKTV